MKKYFLLVPLLSALYSEPGFAQDRIYRCGNEYTNTLPSANARDCKLLQGFNVTVVQGTRPAAKTPAQASPAAQRFATSAGQRVDLAEQKSRDSDARLILESELRKAETRQLELQREYNNGAPERRADETGNAQKYLARVDEIKANLQRNESDISGIRRELGRVSSVAAAK